MDWIGAKSLLLVTDVLAARVVFRKGLHTICDVSRSWCRVNYLMILRQTWKEALLPSAAAGLLSKA
jgi:hypothetical protein